MYNCLFTHVHYQIHNYTLLPFTSTLYTILLSIESISGLLVYFCPGASKVRLLWTL